MKAQALLAAGLLAAAMYCLGLSLKLRPLSLAVKPVPVLCLALWVMLLPGGAHSRLIALGLAVSLLADVLIEASFLAGLVAFLLAHLCYIAAFLVDGPGWLPLRALPFVAWGASVYAFLWPRLGTMRLPVGLYAVVICAMMWRASARVGGSPTPTLEEWAGLAGAVLFAASDTLIALDRFHAPIAGARYPIMLLYLAGQWGIALSARSG